MSTTFASKRGETTKSLAASYQNVYLPPQKTPDAPAAWVRNASWLSLSIPTGSTERFTGLLAVLNDTSNLVAVSATGSLGYTVDWGDGTVENVASGTTQNHTYTFSSISSSTAFTMADGVTTARQVIVNITPNGGTLTGVNLNVKNTKTNLQANLNVPWLDLAWNMPNCSASGLTIGGTTVQLNCLEHATINSIGSCTSFANLFSNCYAFRALDVNGTTSGVTNMSSMFNGCNNLTGLSLFDTSGCTNTSSMFYQCFSLFSVPLFNLSACTNASSMFQNCYALASVPLFNLGACQNCTNMFIGCQLLSSVPLFNLSACTTVSGMFANCYELQSAPPFNLSSCTVISSMFANCRSLTSVGLINFSAAITADRVFEGCISLKTVPLFNLASCTNCSLFFNSAYSLISVPLFNLSAVTNISQMFNNCTALISVPLFNLSACTNAGGMFTGCSSLTSVPLFNLASATNTSSMFSGCYSLLSVPLFNLAACTNANGMFSNCYALKTVPLFNFSANTTMLNMFYNCYSLVSVPLFVLSACTTTQQMFLGCQSLTSVPSFNLSATTNVTSMFNGCRALTSVPAYNVAAVTSGNFGSVFAGCPSLRAAPLSGTKFSISYASCMLSAEALADIFSGLGVGTSQTLTISGNHGAPTPVSLSGITIAGSTTITMTNTTGIVAGMQVTGTGTPLTTPIAVTFQDAGDTVTLTAHGLSNGDEVSFATIVSTTGIVINTIYFVVNAATDTFQVAASAGGAALALTTNGSGTMRYRTEVVSVVTNTSVTLTRKATSSGTNTLAYQTLKTGTALLKGWAVSQ
jgi:hypothetical protein